MACKKLAIIGGGAAAFFCAANLAASELNDKLSITIYEQLNKPMQKLLATGGGRCNLTNNIIDPHLLVKYYPRGEKFLYSVFSQFAVSEIKEWFENNKVPLYIDEQNCIFPKSDSAHSIVNALLNATKKTNITIKCGINVKDISFKDDKYNVMIDNTCEAFDVVLICTGGRNSINKKVQEYNGYNLAKKLGHKVIDPKPALTSLLSSNKMISSLAGITIPDAKITARFKNKSVATYNGSILFTHDGLSGPAILNLSSLLVPVPYNKENKLELNINFTNFDTLQQAEQFLLDSLLKQLNKNILNVLMQFCPRNVGKFILEENAIDPAKKVNSLTKAERKIIAKNLVEFSIPVIAADESSAIVSAGGVDINEINPRTMESKILPNLYFAGEVLNVDGFCGGFNLQFAWSSAFICAKSILGFLNQTYNSNCVVDHHGFCEPS